ncbi:hypothetical protein AURDEDRAFT_168147 [Auricularia subglabra TFB-10046 SS5]|nr:hypothetical protein AURDEDRAFT_168147 [Auricularia subglabra TFB-10046 SS5]
MRPTNDACRVAQTEESDNTLCDPAAALPAELVAEVFGKLDFAGRLAASHVCASWRNIALSNRCLWAQYSIELNAQPRPGYSNAKALALAALLKRSAPVPFRLEYGYEVPDPVAEIIIAHMDRMEVLHLRTLETDDALQRMLIQDIPVLKRFSFSGPLCSDAPITVPPRWAAAPYLGHLKLKCPWVWPAYCVFSSLRSFSGFVPKAPGIDARLSTLFPNLTSLSLYQVTHDSLRCLEPLPRSLKSLRLHNSYEGIDCTSLLRNGAPSSLQQLKISCTRSTPCVLEIFRLCERSVAGPWALYVHGGFINLHAPPSDPHSHRYLTICLDTSWSQRIPEILPLCSRLCELEIDLDQLLRLCVPHAVLPTLASVTLSLVGEKGLYAAPGSEITRPRIHAPSLQSVTLRTDMNHTFEGPIAPVLEEIVRAFRSPRLARVALRTVLPEAFRREDFAALGDAAARAEVQDRSGQTVRVFLFDEEYGV